MGEPSGSEEGQLSSRSSASLSGATPRSPDYSHELANSVPSSSRGEASSPRAALLTPKAALSPKKQTRPNSPTDLPPPPAFALSPVWQQKKLPSLPGKELGSPTGSSMELRAGQKELVMRSLPDLKLQLRALSEPEEKKGGGPTLSGLPQYRAIIEAEGRQVAGTPTGRTAARFKPELEEGFKGDTRDDREGAKGMEGGAWAGTPRSPARALKEKAQSVTLWHEEQSASRSGQMRAVQLQSSPRTPRCKAGSLHPAPVAPSDDDPRVYPPISQPQRVEPLPEWRVPERARSTDAGKGGTGQLADFSVLAGTSHRLATPAARDELRALLSMAVLLENAQESARAIEVYARFLHASQQLNDRELQRLAHNWLGVAHHQQGDVAASKAQRHSGRAVSPGARDGDGAACLSTDALCEYEAAYSHYEQHASLADGDRDSFLACSNLGLLLDKLGRRQEAIDMHKRALAHAIQTGDVACERVSVGNLGSLLLQDSHVLGSAEDCIRRYLDICQSLADGNGIAEGHFLLGIVASSLGKYATAAAEFEVALEAAKASGNKEVARFSRVHIGMAKGRINLAKQLVATDKDLQRTRASSSPSWRET